MTWHTTDGVNHKKSDHGSASDVGQRRSDGVPADELGPNLKAAGGLIQPKKNKDLLGQCYFEAKSALGPLDGRTTDGQITRYSSTNDRNDARGGRFINVACSTALAPDGPM